jgi:hypothetical protein
MADRYPLWDGRIEYSDSIDSVEPKREEEEEEVSSTCHSLLLFLLYRPYRRFFQYKRELRRFLLFDLATAKEWERFKVERRQALLDRFCAFMLPTLTTKKEAHPIKNLPLDVLKIIKKFVYST